jgi:hypothetical protein
MDSRFEQAKIWEEAARRRWEEVYELSVKYLQSPSDAILLDLQECTTEALEKLRSALDFCAAELYERCHGQSPASAGVKVYFPIAPRGAKQSNFAAILGRTIPDLSRARPDLVQLLESFQEFSSPTNRWLPDLATLAMQDRHVQFSHQEKVEHGGLYMTNVSVTDDGSATPRYKSGYLIIALGGKAIIPAKTAFRSDQFTIRGPRTINGSPPLLDPPGEDEAQVQACAFTVIRFKGTGEMVPMFLFGAWRGIQNIIQKLESSV